MTINPVDLSTEDLQCVREACDTEMRRRDEIGESKLRPRHFALLLDRLGACPQVEALRAAAVAENGYVPRARVSELLGRDPAKRLTGFRKPIQRAVTALAASEPGFPTDVVPGPLYVHYGDGVTALGFYVHAQDLPALRSALGG